MQPENQQSPAPNPTSPSPQYDFIYNGQQKPKRRFGLPSPSSNLPKFVLLFAVVSIVLMVAIIIFSSTFLKAKINTDELVGIMARQQEIARISSLVEKQSNDTNVKGLAATTNISLISEQSQLSEYLKGTKQKVDKKKLAARMDKDTEADLQTAGQNNNLSGAYAAYLKENLTDYQKALKAAFDNTPKKAKPILQSAYTSTQTILSSPLVAASQ